MPDAAIADSLEARLRKNPQVADCAVLMRTDATRLIAFVVPAGTRHDEHWLEVEEHSLETGIPSEVLLVDRLPLRPDGALDEQSLLALPSHDPAALAELEQLLAQLPGVRHAAVLPVPRRREQPRLHLDDLLPNLPWQADDAQNALPDAEPDEPARPPALAHGPVRSPAPPEPSTLPQALARSIARGGAGILYIEDDGSEQQQSLTQLREDAERVLAGLRSVGLGAGDFVILQLARPRDVLPAFWGCLFGGFVPVVVPVPASFKGDSSELEKLRGVWGLLGEPTIVSTSEACAALNERTELQTARLCALPALLSCGPDRDVHRAKPDDVAFLSLSSGSTGVPKCIQLTHRNILSRGRASSALCAQSERDVVLNWLPFDHIGSISDWHLRCVDIGCSMVYCSKERVLGNPLNWLRMIEQQRVTHSWAPNFAYALINSALARAGEERWDLSSMKFLLTAGEAVSSRTLEELLSRLKSHGLPATAARSAFGMAELGSGITYSQPSTAQPVKVLNLDRASLRAGLREVPLGDARSITFSSLGPVIAGMSMRIVSADGDLLPERRIGRLQVRGEALSPGYYANPEANQAFHADGWFETGDEGFLDAGELYLTGRSKDCLIINGANYFPIEIEKVVEELPSVLVSFTAAYTVRAPGQQREQSALFFVHSGNGDLGSTLRDVAQRVAQRVGVKLDYIVPVQADDVPKTAIGKIQRKQLAARFEAGGFAEQQRTADLLLGNERTIPSWFATESWQRAALRPCFRRAQSQRYVLLADCQGLAQRVREQLADECVLVVQGAPFEQLDQHTYRADCDDASQLAALLQELAGEQPLHVVDLRPTDRAPLDFARVGATELRDANERFHAFLQGTSSLVALGRIARLTAVGQGAHQVDPGDRLCARGALTPALLHGAKLSEGALHVCFIDLPVEREAQLAHAPHIALELSHDAGDGEVCYRAGLRHVSRLSRLTPSQPRQRLVHEGLYVITGGLGGLAGQLARMLLTRFRARLLLLGRSPLDDARNAQLVALRALGAVEYEAVDVTDAHAVRAAVEGAEQRAGQRSAGFFHLAGTFLEARSVEQQASTVWSVLEAKILGALSLQALLEERPEALMVHYGSAASSFPSEHSAGYAAANRFLDSLARRQRALGMSSYVLGFSAWSGAGMNAQGLSEPMLRERGLHVIAPADGLGSLLAVLSRDPCNVLVGLRAESMSMSMRFAEPALPLAELRGYYLQDGEAPCLPARLDSGATTLPIEQLASAPFTVDGEIDRALLREQLRGPVAAQVPPANVLEQQLLTIWKSVLKTQSLGVTDDFFMQGGHSLLAAELVHAVNERFCTSFPLSLVFEAKTIRAQAQLIDSGKFGKGVSIVPLQPDGNAPPLFCICGINIYQELANELAPHIPVYGVLLPIEGELLAGRDVTLRVPEMAREYARAIREKQPEGPYRVLGLSFGAALAYEAAQQLRAQGAEVSLLTMLDFVHPNGRRRTLRQYARSAITRLKREQESFLSRARNLLSRPEAPVNAQPERATVRMSAYQEAWHAYEPTLQPYGGKVLVIRAEDQSMWDGFEVAADLGWRSFVSVLEHRDVPGDHLSILRAPNVRQLAAHLQAALARQEEAELSTDEVSSLRNKLDQLDRSLLEVLGERMTVVAELATAKREQGLSVRDPAREQHVLDSRLSWGKDEQLPETLVRPMFGLIMSASRERQEREQRVALARPESKTIAVIGAKGGMGRRMCALFESLGHRVLEVDLNSDLSAEEAAARADVTMIAVPIGVTEQVVRAVGPHVPAHGLLMDITSLKQRPLQAMLESTGASVVGTHPMFGPLVSSLQGQRLVICPGRGDAWARWVERTFQAGGLATAIASAEEHDRAMAEVQVLSHFQTQVMGLTLARLGTSLEQSLRFTTPPYLMELYMAARHFSQDSALYGPIAMDNPLTAQVTQAFVDASSTVRDILMRRDTEGLAGVFSEVRSFLGTFAPHGVEQSRHLVDGLMRRGA